MPTFFGAPEVAASGDGRLELFVFDVNGVLQHAWQAGWSVSGDWGGWCDLGQSGEWPATVAANGDGRLVLAVATDPQAGEQLVQSASQIVWSNGWSGWAALPAVPLVPPGSGFFAPGVAANADGRLELFVANGALWRSPQTAWSAGWSDWEAHGAPSGAFIIGPVTAGRSGDGRIEVFVIDQDGRLWNVRQSSANGSYTGWNAFGSPGVALEDRPGLARSADGRLELFVRGTDGQLYHQSEASVGTFEWSGWESFGAGSTPAGGLIDHPVVGADADGRLELFLAGTDGNIYHAWQTQASNGWSDWISEGSAGGGFNNLGGAAPGLGRNGDGRLELFAVARDGNLYHKWQTAAGNGWSLWEQLVPQVFTTTVPGVVGEVAPTAINEILAARLNVETQGEGVWVVNQVPAANTEVPVGSTVQLTISLPNA
jgi:PASTA domain